MNPCKHLIGKIHLDFTVTYAELVAHMLRVVEDYEILGKEIQYINGRPE